MHAPSIVIATATQVERQGWSSIPQPVDWGKDPHIPGTLFARWIFDNGYGASVISTRTFVEVAVLDPEGNITYDTEITEDVARVGSEAELVDVLRRIQAL